MRSLVWPLCIVLLFLFAGCGGGGGGSSSPALTGPGSPMPMPRPPEPEPMPPEPQSDPRLALAIGIYDTPVDFSVSQALTEARAPSMPFGRWPDEYQQEATYRYEIDGTSYDADRNSGDPKLPVPCTDSGPSDPCAKALDDGNYEIELRFSGLIKVSEATALSDHGTAVAEVALQTATTLGPPADYLIRSLPWTGSLGLFQTYDRDRNLLDGLSFPQFSSNEAAVTLIKTLSDLFFSRKVLPTSVLSHTRTPDFTFYSSDFPRLAEAGLRIFNISYTDPGLNLNLVSQEEHLRAVGYYARSVSLGSVHVWAAGNNFGSEVNVQGKQPLYHPQLERGWLAVVALDGDEIAPYSNLCGAASAWCLAAPGRHFVTPHPVNPHPAWCFDDHRTGKFVCSVHGTSMAAPVVAGGIAALKARFPNLTHQQIRDRILLTADKTGIYADQSVYGQGRFDFDAAAHPVGTLQLPHTAFADGPVSPLAGASLQLAPGLAARHLSGRRALVLDSYQRAPFLVDLGSFAQDQPGLGLADLDLDVPLPAFVMDAPRLPGRPFAVRAPGKDHRTDAARWSNAALGFGRGTAALDSLSTALAGPNPLAAARYRLSPDALAAGVALSDSLFGSRLVLRMAFEPRAARRAPTSGVAGQAPGVVLAGSLLSPGGTSSLGLSFASDLAAPAGVSGAGAFAVSGNALDIGYAHRLAVAGPYSLTGRMRMSMIEFANSLLVSADRALVVGVDVEGSYALDDDLSFAVRLEVEEERGGGEVKLHLASAVDEAGTLALAPAGLPHRDTLDRQKASLFLRYGTPGAPGTSWALGGLVQRNAFGETAAVVGARALLKF